MDQLQWFKFSPANWAMGRISKMPTSVQGSYIRLCCVYWNKGCILSIDDAQLELLDEPEAYDTLLKYGIIKLDPENKWLCIEFLNEQYQSIMHRKQILSDSGKKGAQVKANKRVIKAKAKGRLKGNKADKIRIDKDKSRDIHISIEHLILYKDDYDTLCSIWHHAHVDNILDAIGNYQNINKYKSLYLTCRSWLKDKPKLKDQAGDLDTYANNVMKQISK